MKTDAEQVLCRLHLTSTVRRRGSDEPLCQWIVHVAHQEGVQGGTVLRGAEGLAGDGSLLVESAWKPVQRLPVIVELVDGPEHISRLLARVEPELHETMVTLERAHVRLYRAGAVDRSVHAADAPGRQTNVSEVRTMQVPSEGTLLRVFIGEGDRDAGGKPLSESLVRRARERGLAGATVLKGASGFGRHSRLHSARLLELSTDLPVVVELVDSEEKIEAFLPEVDELVIEGLVTLERVRVLRYGPKG